MNRLSINRFASARLESYLQLRSCSSKIKDLLDNAAVGTDNTPQQQADIWSTSPYPEGAVFKNRDQSKKATRSKLDPRTTSIMLFPGQGAQYVGMAKGLSAIPEVKDMFDIAKDVLG